MKKELKNMKGITLIALVITIIVLLILAGVSIAMLTGDNGILTQANNASEKTKTSTAKEKLALILNELQMDSYKNKGDGLNLNEELESKLNARDEISSAIYTNGNIYVVIDGEELYVNDSLNIYEGTIGKIVPLVNVEIVQEACIKITSANPEAYANNAEKEIAKIASKDVTNLKIANNDSSSNSIITITTPDNDIYKLDLSDENAEVTWWAYKSNTFTFTLENSEGEIEDLNVPVNIPYTDEQYLQRGTSFNRFR